MPLALGGRDPAGVEGVVVDRRGHVEVAGVPLHENHRLVVESVGEYAAQPDPVGGGLDRDPGGLPPLAQVAVEGDGTRRQRHIDGRCRGRQQQREEGGGAVQPEASRLRETAQTASGSAISTRCTPSGNRDCRFA